MTSTDPFDLERFVTAQEPVFPTVFAELKAGRKRTHWMWFVFPQLRGLGHSSMATFYGTTSLHEARAYLAIRSSGRDSTSSLGQFWSSRMVRCTRYSGRRMT